MKPKNVWDFYIEQSLTILYFLEINIFALYKKSTLYNQILSNDSKTISVLG